MTEPEERTGLYDFIEAVEAAIKATGRAKREALAQTIDAYAYHFPNEFYWAVGGPSAHASKPSADGDRRGLSPRERIKATWCHTAR
jgi:hypothetical protein